MRNLLEKYPHATEVVKDWFMQKMLESFKDESVPAEFKEFMRQQGITDDRLATILGENPRVLFDILDDNQLIINVVHSINGFSWDVDTIKSVEFHSSRRQAELAAVERAFEILNDRLNTTENEGQDSTASGE